jgi:hypothetical protein
LTVEQQQEEEEEEEEEEVAPVRLLAFALAPRPTL